MPIQLKRRLALLRSDMQKVFACQIPFRYLRGVKFPHPVGIVIGDRVRLGREVRIYQNVTIGLTENTVNATAAQYPTVHDEVTIYAGAVIAGGIVVGARSIVGANAIVTRNVPPDSIAFGYNQIKPR
jgi:serine O-acetyltransferase